MSPRNTEIKDMIIENAQAFEDWSARADADRAKINGNVDSLQERVEMLEAKASNPSLGRMSSRAQDEHLRLFSDWVKKPNDASTKQALENFQHKDVTIGTPSAGGYAVPEVIGNQIDELMRKLSPVRDLIQVRRVGTSDYKELVTVPGTTSGWVSETGSRTATNTSTLRERAPTHGELYALPQVSEWALQDIFFDVQAWLTQQVATEFAFQEGAAFLTGSGSNQPTGIFHTAPVSTSDDSGSRDAAALQFVLTGDNSPASVDADSLIDLVFTFNAAYRPGAQFIMNSNTAGALRKLKDGITGAYVWQPGLANGQPDRLLGYGVQILEAMDDIGGGKLPIAFGQWNRAYLMIDRSDIMITADPYSTPGQIRFYCRRRVGGCVLNGDAAKVLKCL